jgi:hypothetical protein
MSSRLPFFATLATLFAWASTAAAQQSPVSPDSARAQIQATLRAFYFNLAHADWEALTADILAAKVVAHRPAPEHLVLAAGSARRAVGPSSPPGELPPCPTGAAARVDKATITLEGDWAEVVVPRCVPGEVEVDEFRLIRFENRWRLVYIELAGSPHTTLDSGP